MSKLEKYTAIYEKRGKWYVGYVKEIPGANTQGRTLQEVKKNLKEAIKLILETNKSISKKRTKPEKSFKESILVADSN